MRDYAKAREAYTKGCDGGHMASCNNLGSMYQNGQGVKRDYKMANRFYEMACLGNYPMACSNRGYMYEKGLGVKRSLREALRYYQVASDRGDVRGQHNLGRFYYIGLPVGVIKKNTIKARALFQKACYSGFQPSCQFYNLLLKER